MISSRLRVAWILLVTVCSFCWKLSFSARFSAATGLLWSTVLIGASPSRFFPAWTSALSRPFPRTPCPAYTLELENLIRLQHLRPPFLHLHGDLLHDQLGLARLQMRDEDLRRRFQLRE